MSNKDPHFRAYLAMEIAEGQRTKSDDPRVKALVKVIKGTSSDHQLCYAWDKFNDDLSRTILDSFLLANTTFDVIRRTVGVPVDVLDKYSTHIFDTTIFRDLLERISYVRDCKMYLDPQMQGFLEAAIQNGSDSLVYLLTGRHNKTPRDMLEHSMVEGHFTSAMHRGAPITSEHAKQARAWIETSMKSAAHLQRLDPRDDQDALSELKLTLTHTNNVLSPEDDHAPRPEDILH